MTMAAANAVPIAAVCLFLLVLGSAAPPRPEIPETFFAEGNVEVHREETHFGQFNVSWDPDNKRAMENVTGRTPSGAMIDVMTLYNGTEEYIFYYRSNGIRSTCSREKFNGTIPSYWGWLAYATYTGNETLKHVMYDKWDLQAVGVHFEVLVGMTTPNRPFQLIVTETHSQTKYEYLRFSPTAAPVSAYTLPSACK